MENSLQECNRFNKFLARNSVKSLSAYPELEAIFLSLCEKGRTLNYQAPPKMKNLWLCYAYWTQDNGAAAEVLLKLKMDGPLADRDCFIPKRDRETVFQKYRQSIVQRQQRTSRNWENVDMRNVRDDQLRPACTSMLKEIRRLTEVIEGNKERFDFCEKATTSQLLEKVMQNGIVRKIDIFQKLWEQHDAPLVLIDESGRMASLTVKDGEIAEIQSPPWLDNLVLYKEGRKIRYGDKSQNGKIEYKSERNRYKALAKSERKSEYDSRNYTRKRNAEYLENRGDPEFQPRSSYNDNGGQSGIFFSNRSYDRR